MNDIVFASLSDLFTRLYPAFNTKKNELENIGIITKELDLWNYLRSQELISISFPIYKMVDDIMHIDANKLQKYINNKQEGVNNNN